MEGHINKLKLLKRQMYGRDEIELSRRRFLAMGRSASGGEDVSG